MPSTSYLDVTALVVKSLVCCRIRSRSLRIQPYSRRRGSSGADILFRRHRLRSEEHTSELQSPCNIVCRLLLEKKNILDIHLNSTLRGIQVFLLRPIDDHMHTYPERESDDDAQPPTHRAPVLTDLFISNGTTIV